MPQLELTFTNLPDPLIQVWEQLDPQQKQFVIETLARLLAKCSQPDRSEEHPHD